MSHRNDILVFEYNSKYLPYKKSFLDFIKKNHSQRVRIYITTNPESNPIFYVSAKNIETAFRLDINEYSSLKSNIQILTQDQLDELDKELSCNNYNFALSGTNWVILYKLWGVFHKPQYNEDMEQPDYSQTVATIKGE